MSARIYQKLTLPRHSWRSGLIAGLIFALALLGAVGRLGAASGDAERAAPCLILLTLDTTRADHLGAYGDAAARTPVLDALAARGVRYARAVSPAPLTLPAHASLLTGLAPPAHGVRDNGLAALGDDVPTLATVLGARGYATGAFIASRVLDRRFGLARGFDVYDDRMSAEQIGEYGYPERDAAAVTDAAVAWLAEVPSSRPFFLWAHYYDPHSPYAPPAAFRGASTEASYAGEIAYMDQQIGRLLAAVPAARAGSCLTVAVGDHGEALGEHGERTHGLFLYRSVIEVPLILAGPGVPRGKVVTEAVPILRVAATAVDRLGLGTAPLPPAVLPGLDEPSAAAGKETAADDVYVYSETQLPATAYGWSALKAFADQRWRLIVAPRPELYDEIADPEERHNLVREEREVARRLARALERYEADLERRQPARADADPELAASLRSLGYLSGASGGERSGLDPKDGVALLDELTTAKELLAGGRTAEAVAALRRLNDKSPGNVPFLTNLANALLESGAGEEAVATFRQAITLNPGLDFLHLQLAEAYRALGRADDARREYQLTVDLNPRFAAAWLGLAEIAARAGDGGEERRLLAAAAAAGTDSAAIFLRLGQIELAAGETAAAAGHLERATALASAWPLAWLVRGQVEIARGRTAAARDALERAAALAPGSPAEREARRLLATL